MRTLYTFLFYFLIPFIFIRLLWRSIKAPPYRYRWNERLGFYTKQYPKVTFWFHAVSVGETEALYPLAQKIIQDHPEARLLITTTTPTGSARVAALFKNSVEHVYLPYDIPASVKRFLQVFKPDVGVIMETEIWPNLFASCGQNKIPLYIINARLSERSSRGYQKIPSLIRPTLANVQLIAAQTREDADRFISIGVDQEKVKVLGNIKFDVEIPQKIIEAGRNLKADLFSGRYAWLIASTHAGEESQFLELYKELKENIPELILVIVPRHPERFDEVKKLCGLQQCTVLMRSSKKFVNTDIDVYLVDSMGELKMFYAAADVAFVGGSMVPVGGHNILEPAAIGVPTLFGPYMANFKEIARGILKLNAAIQCRNQNDIKNAVLAFHARPEYRKELVENGRLFIAQNQGALNRIYAILEKHCMKSITH